MRSTRKVSRVAVIERSTRRKFQIIALLIDIPSCNARLSLAATHANLFLKMSIIKHLTPTSARGLSELLKE